MGPESINKWMPTKLRENQDFEHSVLLLKLTGMLPPTGNDHKTRLDRALEVALPSMVVVGAIVGSVLLPLGALTSRDNLATVFECVCIGCLHLTSVIKIWYVSTRPEAFKRFTSRLATARRNDIHVRNDPSDERRKICEEVQSWINVFVMLTVFCVASLEGTFVVRAPELLVSRKHVARIWFPVDPYTSPTYEILFVIWNITLALMAAASCSLDGYMVAVLVGIVGQLRLLCYDLTRIREDAVESVIRRREKNCDRSHTSLTESFDCKASLEIEETIFEDSREVEVDKEMKRLLGECVYRYQECGELVREAEELLGPILVQAVINTVVSLLAGIMCAGIDPGLPEDVVDAAEIARYNAIHQATTRMQLAIVGSVCAQLAVCCFLVDRIVDAGELVRDAVYGCDWFASTEAFKRSIRIVMSRANQPLVISVAGYLPLTLETFLAIMNLAYSYYTTMNAAVQ